MRGFTSLPRAAAASAEIPLTHRRASSAVVFVTGHQASESETIHWNKLANSGATLVIYMPGQNYSDVARKLTSAGLAGETPCAIVSRATTKHQRTHRTTVAKLHRAPRLPAPTLLVVGEVVRFADPVAVVDDFVVPHMSDANSSSYPLQLFETVPLQASRSTADEEPIA